MYQQSLEINHMLHHDLIQNKHFHIKQTIFLNHTLI